MTLRIYMNCWMQNLNEVWLQESNTNVASYTRPMCSRKYLKLLCNTKNKRAMLYEACDFCATLKIYRQCCMHNPNAFWVQETDCNAIHNLNL